LSTGSPLLNHLDAGAQLQYLYCCTSKKRLKQVKTVIYTLPQPPRRTFCVSICTFEPVKQVNCAPRVPGLRKPSKVYSRDREIRPDHFKASHGALPRHEVGGPEVVSRKEAVEQPAVATVKRGYRFGLCHHRVVKILESSSFCVSICTFVPVRQVN